jgi:hypothetical protein
VLTKIRIDLLSQGGDLGAESLQDFSWLAIPEICRILRLPTAVDGRDSP